MSAISTRIRSVNTKQRAKQLADRGHTVDRRCCITWTEQLARRASQPAGFSIAERAVALGKRCRGSSPTVVGPLGPSTGGWWTAL